MNCLAKPVRLVAGCETAPRIEIQRVNVAVPVKCKEQVPERPVMPTEALQPGATVDQFTQSAQAEIERREGYEGKMRAALVVCTATVNFGGGEIIHKKAVQIHAMRV